MLLFLIFLEKAPVNDLMAQLTSERKSLLKRKKEEVILKKKGGGREKEVRIKLCAVHTNILL